jgi:hypothetical protein
LFREHTLGDIEAQAGQNPTGWAVVSGCPAFDPSIGAIGQKETELDVELVWRLPAGAQGLGNAGAIFEMDEVEEVVNGELTRVGPEPEDGGGFSRERDLAG